MKDRSTALNWNGCLLKGQKIENEPNFIKLCSFRANNACLGPVAPKMVVKDPSGHHQWILLLYINWWTWKKSSGFPLTSSNRKKMVEMLTPGPICSIRAECGRGSCQIWPFLTSESDSTGRKPWNMFNGIACDIPLTFWAQLMHHLLVENPR